MTRLIDADRLEDDCNLYDKWDAQIVKEWLKDQPTVEAVPVEFIKTEIDRLIDDINDAVEDGTTEWAEIIMIRKATLELVLVKWRAEKKEE